MISGEWHDLYYGAYKLTQQATRSRLQKVGCLATVKIIEVFRSELEEASTRICWKNSDVKSIYTYKRTHEDKFR